MGYLRTAAVVIGLSKVAESRLAVFSVISVLSAGSKRRRHCRERVGLDLAAPVA